VNCQLYDSKINHLATTLHPYEHSQDFKMLFSSVFGAVALLAAEAAAHGAVTSYVIGGKEYPGYV